MDFSSVITSMFKNDKISLFDFRNVGETIHGTNNEGPGSGLFRTAGDTLNGTSRNDTIYGYNGDDTLNGGAGADKLYGGNGSDHLNGGAGNDRLYGGAGNDILSGDYQYSGDLATSNTVSDDYLDGGSGADRLFGGGGKDTLIGGLGQDILTGGTGADRFVYNSAAESRVGSGVDTITDFQRGVDKIDLSAIDANPHLSGNQAFRFGTYDPNRGPGLGEVTAHFDAKLGKTIVEVGTNVLPGADMRIELDGNVQLSQNDFVL